MGTENLGDPIYHGCPFFTIVEGSTPSSVAAYGKFWVKSDAPNTPYFTDDSGVSAPLSRKVYPLVNTYVSGSGTAGSDATAQDVKTVVIPANTLIQVNDRLRIRTYFKGDTGGGVTATTKLNTVEIAAATDGGGASFFTTEAWLHYIDNTHANIIETGAYPATGSNSAENVAGFDWASDQNAVVSQNSVANNHIIVYCIFLDVFPKGAI